MLKKLSLLSIALIALSLSVSLQTAHAEGIGLTIQPVKISQTLTPGDTATGFIHLTNASDADVKVDVSVQDFIPVAGAESIQFVSRAPGITTVRDWITIGGADNFIFKKGESRDIDYKITAPKNAEPGSHFGVAFFKATKLSSSTDQLKVGTQVGMLVLVTIPGNHLQKGIIHDFTAPKFLQKGPVPFVINFENTGTVHFEPKGEITIKNMFGKQVGTVPIEGQIVLPTGVKDLRMQWDVGSFLLGKYTALATIKDGDGNTLTSKEVSFWVFPIWYIIGFLVALIVIFYILRFFKRRVRFSVSLK